MVVIGFELRGEPGGSLADDRGGEGVVDGAAVVAEDYGGAGEGDRGHVGGAGWRREWQSREGAVSRELR